MIKKLMMVGMVMFLAGCGGEASSSQGRVAILDLERVAKATGWDRKISTELRQAQQRLDQSLKQLGDEINQNLQKMSQELGESPTDEQRKQFIQAQQDGQRRWNNARGERDNLLRQTNARLLGEFRDEVKPYSRKAGEALGFKIVIVLNDTILNHDMGSNITDAVIAAMLNEGKKYTPPEGKGTAAPESGNPPTNVPSPEGAIEPSGKPSGPPATSPSPATGTQEPPAAPAEESKPGTDGD